MISRTMSPIPATMSQKMLEPLPLNQGIWGIKELPPPGGRGTGM
jgi:hypothetical protein